MSSAHDEMLEQIAIERECFRTFHRFFRIADGGNPEDFRGCFTPNALIEYHVMPGPVQRFHGRDEFTARMTRGPRNTGSMVAHVLGQAYIDWDTGSPVLTAYATVWHWYALTAHLGQDRPADWTVIGLVVDEFEQFEGQWLISKRNVRPVAGRVALLSADAGGAL